MTNEEWATAAVATLLARVMLGMAEQLEEMAAELRKGAPC